MRYKELITEGKSIESIAELLYNECNQWFRNTAMSRLEYSLFRGHNDEVTGIKKKQAHLNNRNTLSTLTGYHDITNAYFTKHYGRPFRNGVFATKSEQTASFYGYAYTFLPVGKFEFLWSPTVYDYTTNLDDELMTLGKDKLTKEIVLNYLKDNPYQKTELTRAIKSGFEIMFWCEEYYLIDDNLVHQLTEYNNESK